jgi:hypothetical protein
MVRVRSSLFVYNLATAWVIGICLAILFIVKRPNEYGGDSWRSNPNIASTFNLVSLVVLIAFGIIALLLLGLEIRLRNGWEPRSMEVFKPGCEILKMTSSLDKTRATVMVRLNGGAIDTYEADPDEMRELQVGSISHLWVIGRYISRIRLVNPIGSGPLVTQSERMAILPQMISLRSGLGVIVAITREVQITNGGLKRNGGIVSSEFSRGNWVPIAGMTAMIVGLVILASLGYVLHKGWDDVALEDRRSESLENRILDNRGRRGLWW